MPKKDHKDLWKQLKELCQMEVRLCEKISQDAIKKKDLREALDFKVTADDMRFILNEMDHLEEHGKPM